MAEAAGSARHGAPPALRALGRPAAVVFDCDGVLVDTEPIWGQAEQVVYARHGVPYTTADRDTYLGLSVADATALMAARFGEPGTAAALDAELVDAAVDLLAVQARPMPGVVELIARLGEAGVPIGVASNSPARAVRATLVAAGLADVFAVVVTTDDVSRPKPDPEPYLQACARLGAEPSRSLAIEDSRTGLAAALAAGMATIGLPMLPGDFPADWVLASLADPAVAEWVASW